MRRLRQRRLPLRSRSPRRSAWWCFQRKARRRSSRPGRRRVLRLVEGPDRRRSDGTAARGRKPAAQAAQKAASGADGSRLRGAARGAAAGAIIGEVADDDAGQGAAIGATAGVVAGGRQSRKNSRRPLSRPRSNSSRRRSRRRPRRSSSWTLFRRASLRASSRRATPSSKAVAERWRLQSSMRSAQTLIFSCLAMTARLSGQQWPAACPREGPASHCYLRAPSAADSVRSTRELTSTVRSQ
jgi:hypothetical protein